MFSSKVKLVISNQELLKAPLFIVTGFSGAFNRTILKLLGTTSKSLKKNSNSSGELPSPCSHIIEWVAF